MENDLSGLLKLKPFNDGKLMEGIFVYQKHLIGRYIDKNMLPSYPLDLNSKADQKFIRDTMGWLVEELAEAADEYDKAMGIFKTDVYTDAEVRKSITGFLPKLTEELMDALHFFVELLHYSNISDDDMLGYYTQRLTAENYQEAFLTKDALATSMMYARHININTDEHREGVFNAFNFGNSPSLMELPADTILAGSKMGIELEVVIERMLWATTKLLYKSKNKLRKTDWREKEQNTNIQAYQENLMEAWVYFTVLLDLFQLTDKSIYWHYEAKNLIVQQRLIDGY